MGAKLCIENSTDRDVVVHLEQLTVRYWAYIPKNQRVIWNPAEIHVDRGVYTLRAVDARSSNYKAPNMRMETAKAVIGGTFLGAGGIGVIVSAPFFAIPGVILSGVGGAIVGVGAIVTTGTSVLVAGVSQGAYHVGVKRGCHIGSATKYVVRLTEDHHLTWINEPFNPTDMTRTGTIIANGSDRHITASKFADLRNPAITLVEPQSRPHRSGESATTRLPTRMICEHCDYFKRCKKFFNTLVETVGTPILDPQFDKCFCKSCAAQRGDNTVFQMGDPPKKFAVPRGYAKFGVKINSQAESEDIFKKWHVCYHGTAIENVSRILKAGRLLKPGDKTASGELREPGPGRFREDTSPEGHNVNQYFFSPTPAYCEYGNLYAKTFFHTDTTTNKCYEARAVLQIRLKPNSYRVGPQTMGATTCIDPNFSNDELEWMTDCECVHHIYGVLIKLEECHNPTRGDCNIL